MSAPSRFASFLSKGVRIYDTAKDPRIPTRAVLLAFALAAPGAALAAEVNPSGAAEAEPRQAIVFEQERQEIVFTQERQAIVFERADGQTIGRDPSGQQVFVDTADMAAARLVSQAARDAETRTEIAMAMFHSVWDDMVRETHSPAMQAVADDHFDTLATFSQKMGDLRTVMVEPDDQYALTRGETALQAIETIERSVIERAMELHQNFLQSATHGAAAAPAFISHYDSLGQRVVEIALREARDGFEEAVAAMPQVPQPAVSATGLAR